MITGTIPTPFGKPTFTATGKHADALSIALIIISVAVLVYNVKQLAQVISK